MAASVSSENGEIGFQIAPMVDVVFVLLLFFMACAGTRVVEKELSVNLPRPAAGSTPLTVEISASGEVSMNGKVYDSAGSKTLPELRQFLREAVSNYGGDDPVVLYPAATVRQERVIDVLNACTAAHVRKLSFG